MAVFFFIYHNFLMCSALLAILGLVAGLLLSRSQHKWGKYLAYGIMIIGLLLCAAALFPGLAGYLIFIAINIPITGLALALIGLIAGVILSKCRHKRSMRIAYGLMTVGIVLFFLSAIPRTGGPIPPYQFTADGIATISNLQYSADKKQLTVKLDVMPKHPRQFIYRMYYKNTVLSDRLIAKTWLSVQPIRSIINNYYSDMNSKQQLACPMNKTAADALIARKQWQQHKQIAAVIKVSGCSGCMRTTDLISPVCPK